MFLVITVHSAQRGGKIRKSELYCIFRLNLCYKIRFLYPHFLYAVKRFKSDQCLCEGLRTCHCVKLFLLQRHSLVVPTHNYTEIVYGSNLDKKYNLPFAMFYLKIFPCKFFIDRL